MAVIWGAIIVAMIAIVAPIYSGLQIDIKQQSSA